MYKVDRKLLRRTSPRSTALLPILFAVCCQLSLVRKCFSFSYSNHQAQVRNPLRPRSIFRSHSPDENEGPYGDDKERGPIPLPPIGASSFWDNNSEEEQQIPSLPSQPPIVVSPKFQLQYTCKVCSHRNSHSVTRLAYRQGVVICVCKGCQSKHLIADNLGWSNLLDNGFDFDNGERNIEQYMQNRVASGNYGDEDDRDVVLRVGKEVFDLEKILYKDHQASERGITHHDDYEGDHGIANDWS